MNQMLAGYFRVVTKIIPGVAGGNAGANFTFDDQPDLRNARLLAMCFLTDQDMLQAPQTNTPVTSAVNINKISFNFMTNDPYDFEKKGKPGEKVQGEQGRFTGTLETIQYMPASLLHINQTGGVAPAGTPSFVRQPIMWYDRYIIWQKSEILISGGGLLNTSDVAICLGVYYSFYDNKGQIISPRN
jgi:hypothetical protein